MSRFLNNDRVTPGKLLESLTSQCSKYAAGREVIVLQDTTEYNYQHHLRKLRIEEGGLGLVGNNADIGFFAHPSFVLEAEHEVPIGFSHLLLWHRPLDKQTKYERDYNKLPIEEKESYRWILSAQESKKVLSQARHTYHIADREADIYQKWVTVPDEKNDLIVRSRSNRNLYQEEQSLYQAIENASVLGSYQLQVKGNPSKSRTTHTAQIDIKACKVKINKPPRIQDPDLPPFVEVWAIQAKEATHTVKKGESPVHWIILTSCDASTLDRAREVVRKYTLRWQIEQLFRVSKSQGLDMESSQVETGKGLQVLLVFALQVALRILQLSQGREQEKENIPAEIIFSTQQVVLLKVLSKKMAGKTLKQTNQYRPESLPWASWVIGRLGGWKGYSSGSPPGPITMHHGLKSFHDIFNGWAMAQDVCID